MDIDLFDTANFGSGQVDNLNGMNMVWNVSKFSWAIISFVYLDNLITIQMPYSTRCGYEQILSVIQIHSNFSNYSNCVPDRRPVQWVRRVRGRMIPVMIPIFCELVASFKFLMNDQILSWTRFRRWKTVILVKLK